MKGGRNPVPALPGGTRGAYWALGFLILVWGMNWSIMKIGLRDISPLQFTAMRLSLGAATLFLVLPLIGRLKLPTRADLGIVLSVGLLQMGLFLALVNTGLLWVGAGRSAVLAYTTPLWVVPLATLVLGERLTRLKLVGLLVGLAGLAVMFNPLDFDWSNRDTLLGNGLLMLGALCWAIAILHVRAHRWTLSPLELAPWQFLVAAVPFSAVALWVDGDKPITWSTSLLAVLAYNGPLATALGFVAAVSISRALPAVTTSLGFLGVPVAGILFSALILGEPLTLLGLTGPAMVLGGLVIAAISDLPKARKVAMREETAAEIQHRSR